MAGAEEERRDGEDAGAGAEVEHLLTALNGALELAHAHLRGGMRAGAEDHAGVEQDDDAVVRVFGVEPFGHNKQLLADGERLIILFPVVFPVFVADVGERDLKRAKVDGGIVAPEDGQIVAKRADLLRRCGAVLQIEADLGKTLHFLLEIFVDIIPVLVVFFQKPLEILLVVDDKAVESQNGQPVADQVDGGGGRFDGYFDPLHR